MGSTLESCSKSRRGIDPLVASEYVKSIAGKFARINGMDREDVEQDTWVEVIQASKRCNHIGQLITAARQGAIHAVRYHKTEKRTNDRNAYRVHSDGEVLDIPDAFSDLSVYDRVVFQRVLSGFSDFEQKCFVLFSIHGHGLHDVMAILDSSYDKVRRANEKVRRALMEVFK